MQAQNLQLAISANAVIKSLQIDREKDVMKRLDEASRHLAELIDNLETQFLNRERNSPSPVTPASPATSNIGHTEIVTASQREYMQAMTELLRKKDEIMERMNTEHNKIMREIIQAHEETIRHISQSREETNRVRRRKRSSQT